MQGGSDMAAPADDVADVVVHDQYEPVLERAMGRLPGRYRQVLELLASPGSPSYEDVARRMNVPVGSIGPMRLRGLQMLRRDAELQRLAPKMSR